MAHYLISDVVPMDEITLLHHICETKGYHLALDKYNEEGSIQVFLVDSVTGKGTVRPNTYSSDFTTEEILKDSLPWVANTLGVSYWRVV